MNKRTFALASAAVVLFAASAQAYIIDDENTAAYWGAGRAEINNDGEPNHYTSPGRSGDVYDPGSEGYAISGMDVSYASGELTVTVYSSTYFDKWVKGSLSAGPGSLFISTNGWHPAGSLDSHYNTDGMNSTYKGEIWEYAITLNNSVTSDGKITKENGAAVLKGTASLYNVIADSIKFGTSRTVQEAYYSPTNETALNQGGTWAYQEISPNHYALIITMSIGKYWNELYDLGLHWTMRCANDVVEGSIPGIPVPEPGTLALFTVGALGLAGMGRRRRS